MTAYFDSFHDKIHAVSEPEASRQLDTLEELVVFDCTVAAMMSGFPEDLRMAVHAVVLRFGAFTLPVNAPPAPFDDTIEQHKDRLKRLTEELHTVFHNVEIRDIAGLSDDPRTPLRVLYARGEEEREGMISKKSEEVTS